jgi:anaerobic ribonucleoside-triphosphate reductase activating protein
MKIRLFGAVPDSIVDGPGLRYGVFVQGCSHGCPGCHNPESQPAQGGTLTTTEAVLEDIKANPLVKSVTLSGGEPFEQPAACAELARALKAEGYGVWAYTGYLYEDLLTGGAGARAQAAGLGNQADVLELLANVDVLVDGPFVQAQKSLSLNWKGSANQRLIDVPASTKAGRVVLWQPKTITLTKPENW